MYVGPIRAHIGSIQDTRLIFLKNVPASKRCSIGLVERSLIRSQGGNVMQVVLKCRRTRLADRSPLATDFTINVTDGGQGAQQAGRRISFQSLLTQR
jgi:hypothetical protein